MKKRIIILLAMYCLLLPGIFAQAKPTLSSSVNKSTISQSERLIFTLRLTTSIGSRYEFPASISVPGLQYLTHHTTQESYREFSGGQSTNVLTVTYSYIFLPMQTGNITIGTQAVKVDGRTLPSPPVTVNIQPDASGYGSGTPQRDPGDPFSGFGFSDQVLQEGETLLICLPETQSVYRSEPAIVSYYLYTTEDVRSFNLNDEVDGEGYGKAVFEQPRNLIFEAAEYQGRRFRRSLLKRLALYPHTTGTLTAPSMEGTVRMMRYGYYNRNLRSLPTTILVKDLPPRAPAGFSGAIGEFTFSEKLSTQSIKVGEALIWSIQITGQGNFNQFTAPQIKSTSQLQISSPRISDQINAGVKGTRILQYTIIPKSKGEISLPRFRFAWLNSKNGTYRVYESKAQTLSVKAGSAAASTSDLQKLYHKWTMQDLIPRQEYESYVPTYSKPWYWLVLALLFASLPVSLVIARRRKRQLLNPHIWLQRKLNQQLKACLAQAKAVIAKSPAEFYPFADACIMDYLQQKHGIPAHLALDDLLIRLEDEEMSPDLLQKIRSFLSAIRTARFAPVEYRDSSAEALLADFNHIVSQLLDEEIK
ncbi:MAG: BatD family protein [Candidatus Cloacimonetes bacterium]|nr:BatD family protein [Candidatus Cloacimonadota bacterium]